MKYLNGAPNRIPPQQDSDISRDRKEYLKKNFANEEKRISVSEEFASFLLFMGLVHFVPPHICETNWSTFKFILYLRRNKITPQRA
jgi:hypothetical protein